MKLELTPAERSALRSAAHPLKPVVMIGDAGLTPAVMTEIDRSLTAHGLIKVRMAGDDRTLREQAFSSICETLGAAPVQHIGKLLVIYRPQPEDSEASGTRRRVDRQYSPKRNFQNR